MRQKPDPLESHPSLGPLFEPAKTGPLYGKTDPATSRASAEALKSDRGRLGRLQRETLAMVMRFPGSTAMDLAKKAYIEAPEKASLEYLRQRFGRRLSELGDAGFIEARGKKKDEVTGFLCQLWWPPGERG